MTTSEMLKPRSKENYEAINRNSDLPSIMASILRQELDSMIRVIYLLNIKDLIERERLMSELMNGKM